MFTLQTHCVLGQLFAMFPEQQPKFSLHYEYNHNMCSANVFHSHKTLWMIYKNYN